MSAISTGKDQKKCLDDLQVVRFALQKCSESEHQQIEAHISKCTRCFEEVVSLLRAQRVILDETLWETAPDLTREKEIALKTLKGLELKPDRGTDIFKIILQFMPKQAQKLMGPTIPLPQLRIVSHTGTACQPVRLLGADRGRMMQRKPDFTALPKLFKNFGGYRVEVTIEGKGGECIDLYIKVKPKDGQALAPKATFTLIDEQKSKILEELTQVSPVSFNNLKPGEYTIKIALPEAFIGAIALGLREA